MTPPNDSPFSLPPAPLPPRRRGASKPLLALVFVGLLAALAAVMHFSSGAQSGDGLSGPSSDHPGAPPPKLDVAKLAQQWPAIQAHAAAPPRGPADAPYTMVEFGDFQCPPCGAARPKLEKLLTRYPKAVNLLFLQRPLPNLHPHAIPAAQASEVAAAQGKFWPMYDVLYQNQDDLEEGYFGEYAAKVGLDKAQFVSAFQSGTSRSKVEESMKFADSLGVESTPTVLVRDNKTGKITAVQYRDIVGKESAPGSKVFADGPFVTHPLWQTTARTASAH